MGLIKESNTGGRRVDEWSDSYPYFDFAESRSSKSEVKTCVTIYREREKVGIISVLLYF